MTILLLAPTYLNLYKTILKELQNQGHIVKFAPLLKYPENPYFKEQNTIKRFIKKKWFESNKKGEKYWTEELKDPIYNQSYDILFVIQGNSFHPLLTNHLRLYNKRLKTVLYIWDSNRMYDFFRNVDYFDKVYSFDLYDVKHYGNGKVHFLPFFWSKDLLKYENLTLKYDLSSIGTNHHGRFNIFKKVIQDAKLSNHTYFIRLITNVPIRMTLKMKLEYLLALLFSNTKKLDYIKFLIGNDKYDFVESDFYDMENNIRIMAESRAILDTDNPLQSGTTPRLIWALALNKHIFTTNQNIKNLSFYNEKYIHIIDRDNPIIDYSLTLNEIDSRQSVNYLRIDNWIKFFIE